MAKEWTILAISGSLRQQSSNTALMHAIMGLSEDSMQFKEYTGLVDLPHFNPDLDKENVGPKAVELFRKQLREADGVLICTPEYGNGVPGVLKNALDWLVSSGELVGKPTAVISASPSPMGGDKAHASLLLTLHMIHAEIVTGSTMIIPHITLKLNVDESSITSPALKDEITQMLEALTLAIETKKNRD
ncbi:NADPH-dependent FMN reductase [Paenibacillus shirakamiensis]|nr:NAD(P)H-dependent oxidoreductase [Paenibacillus shirakamiensis]